MNILVIKTNLRTKKMVAAASKLFDRHPRISEWNVDREDPDKILRIEATGELSEEDLLVTLSQGGFYGELLPD